MAGRGTDIKLRRRCSSILADSPSLVRNGTIADSIDLQLRGRSGRQGDPGESQFYISLEDNLMSLFKSDRVAKVMDRLNLEEGAVITHPWVNKSIERAQKKVEQNNFGIRKRQLEYDDVLNAQRQVIYDQRTAALHGDRLRGEIMDMLRKLIENIVDAHYGDGNLDGMKEELLRVLALDFDVDLDTFARLGEDGVADRIMQKAENFYNRKREALAAPFLNSIQKIEESDQENKPEKVFVDFTDGRRMLRVTVKIQDILNTNGQAINNALERVAMLSFIDEHWTEHLRGLDEVKEGIGLRAFGQRDPLVEYKMEAFKLFKEMMETIHHDVVSFVSKAGPLVNNKQGQNNNSRSRLDRKRLDPNRARSTHASANPSYGIGSGNQPGAREKDPSAGGQQTVVVGERTRRNDPCPCGSGKKYKHCHGRNQA